MKPGGAKGYVLAAQEIKMDAGRQACRAFADRVRPTLEPLPQTQPPCHPPRWAADGPSSIPHVGRESHVARARRAAIGAVGRSEDGFAFGIARRALARDTCGNGAGCLHLLVLRCVA